MARNNSTIPNLQAQYNSNQPNNEVGSPSTPDDGVYVVRIFDSSESIGNSNVGNGIRKGLNVEGIQINHLSESGNMNYIEPTKVSDNMESKSHKKGHLNNEMAENTPVVSNDEFDGKMVKPNENER